MKLVQSSKSNFKGFLFQAINCKMFEKDSLKSENNKKGMCHVVYKNMSTWPNGTQKGILFFNFHCGNTFLCWIFRVFAWSNQNWSCGTT